MEALLNLQEFDVPAKNPSEEALLRWRKAVGLIIKNRRRRFRMTADIRKRSEAELKKRTIQLIAYRDGIMRLRRKIDLV